MAPTLSGPRVAFVVANEGTGQIDQTRTDDDAVRCVRTLVTDNKPVAVECRGAWLLVDSARSHL